MKKDFDSCTRPNSVSEGTVRAVPSRLTEQYAFDREMEYFDAQDDARNNGRGLWAMDNPEPPWNFKRRQRRRSRASEGQGRLF